jgi:acetyltransferase-like isoleucine patch superfamily enzyme
MQKTEPQKIDSGVLIRDRLYGDRKSAIAKYRELVLGDAGILAFLRYEILTGVLGPIPGALGLALRKVFYRSLFEDVGRGVIFGRNLVIRHPDKISLGNGVVIDDYALLDARGGGENGIEIGDRTLIHRGSVVQAKAGPVRIGAETNVGAGSVIVSMGGTYIGDRVGIGGGCYISGGSFGIATKDGSLRDQQKYTKGPVRLDDKVWLGMRVTVLDGVHVGEGCIVGAGSLVTRDLPPYSVAAGHPAEIRGRREPQAD